MLFLDYPSSTRQMQVSRKKYSSTRSPLRKLKIRKEPRTSQTSISNSRRGSLYSCTDLNLKSFFTRRSEPSVQQGSLMWSLRTRIPPALRTTILGTLHEAHPVMQAPFLTDYLLPYTSSQTTLPNSSFNWFSTVTFSPWTCALPQVVCRIPATSEPHSRRSHAPSSSSSDDPPGVAGVSFAADVIKRGCQHALLLRNCTTSKTVTKTLLLRKRSQNQKRETCDALRDALVRLVVALHPFDGPKAVIPYPWICVAYEHKCITTR